MTLEEGAKEMGFTMKYLRILVRIGAIQRFPTFENMIFLSQLKDIWKNTECLKEGLPQIRSKARREKLVRELELWAVAKAGTDMIAASFPQKTL